MAKKPTPEGQLQVAVLAYLAATGYGQNAWRQYTGPTIRGGGARRPILAPNPNKGIPDIFVISLRFPGILFTFELKSIKGVCSPEQKIWHARLRAAGVRCAVIRSLDEFKTTLAQFEEEAFACCRETGQIPTSKSS